MALKGSVFPFIVTVIHKEVHSNESVLKGQATFFKLCLLVVCMALNIPRFTCFLIKIRFHAEKGIHMPVLTQSFLPGVDMPTSAQI